MTDKEKYGTLTDAELELDEPMSDDVLQKIVWGRVDEIHDAEGKHPSLTRLRLEFTCKYGPAFWVRVLDLIPPWRPRPDELADDFAFSA
jgi:hypothetical protein